MSESVQRARRPWAISEMVSWVVIVLAVGLVMVSVMLRQRAEAKGDPEVGGVHEPKMQSVLSARYAVGVNELMKLKGGMGGASLAGSEREALGQVVEALDREAKRPEEKLRAAIVRGELMGTEQAQEKMRPLAAIPGPMEQDVATVERLYGGEGVDADELAGLRERHGWFADLAASHGKPETDPTRAAVVSAGIRTLATVVAIMVVAIGVLLVGMVLLIVAIVLLVTGKLRLAFERLLPLPGDRRGYVQGFALFILCYVGGSLILRVLLVNTWDLPEAVTMVVGLAVLVLSVVSGLLWPIFRGQRWSEWKAATGFHTGRGVVREILSGWAGYVAGFPVLIGGMLVTLLLLKLSNTDASHPIIKELGGGPITWVMVFVLATVWAPVTEELMFRGMLFASLRERFGWWISAPIVAFVFAAIHPQGWAAIPVLGAIAIVLAGIREWRGSVIGCMAAHALHNGVAVIVATLMLT